MPDCPASGQSGTGLKKTNDAGTVPVPDFFSPSSNSKVLLSTILPSCYSVFHCTFVQYSEAIVQYSAVLLSNILSSCCSILCHFCQKFFCPLFSPLLCHLLIHYPVQCSAIIMSNNLFSSVQYSAIYPSD